MSAACLSCGEEQPNNECAKSQRVCGHHCNCSWVQCVCHWCDESFGEVDSGGVFQKTNDTDAVMLDVVSDTAVGQLGDRVLFRRVDRWLACVVDGSVQLGSVPWSSVVSESFARPESDQMFVGSHDVALLRVSSTQVAAVVFDVVAVPPVGVRWVKLSEVLSDDGMLGLWSPAYLAVLQAQAGVFLVGTDGGVG